MLDLIVVIPVFNEESCIEAVINSWESELDKLFISYQILVINDGSKDRTTKILNDIASPKVKHIYKDNSGHGPSIIVGYAKAIKIAKWVFQVDSDNEIEAKHFYKLWEARQEFDAVFGVRVNRSQPISRKFVSIFSKACVALFFGTKIKDVNVPYRLQKSSVLKGLIAKVPSNSFAPNTIISGLLSLSTAQVRNVEVPNKQREIGQSSISGFKLIKVASLSFYQLLLVAFSVKNRNKKPLFKPFTWIVILTLFLICIDLVSDPEVRYMCKAVFARRKPDKQIIFELQNTSYESLYKKYSYKYKNTLNKNHFINICQYGLKNMAAPLYEKRADKSLTPANFFILFFDELMSKCDQVKLNPVVLLNCLYETGTVLYKGIDHLEEDINISRIQLIGGVLTRHYSTTDHPLIRKLSYKTSIPIINLGYVLQKHVASKYLKYFDFIRLFTTSITTGIEDYGLLPKAKAVFIYMPELFRAEFISNYPNLSSEFIELILANQKIEQERTMLLNTIERVLALQNNGLDLFFLPQYQTKPFNSIGIGEKIDPWQFGNYTYTLKKAGELTQDLKNKSIIKQKYRLPSDRVLSKAVISHYKTLYKSNPKKAKSCLIREQVQNPKIQNFLLDYAIKTQNKEAEKTIKQLKQDSIDLRKAFSNLRPKLIKSLIEEGQYEQDLNYQITTIVAIHKMYSMIIENNFGQIEANSIDSIAFHTLGLLIIRELSFVRMYAYPIAKDSASDDGLAYEPLLASLITARKFYNNYFTDTFSYEKFSQLLRYPNDVLPPSLMTRQKAVIYQTINFLNYNFGILHQKFALNYYQEQIIHQQ